VFQDAYLLANSPAAGDTARQTFVPKDSTVSQIMPIRGISTAYAVVSDFDNIFRTSQPTSQVGQSEDPNYNDRATALTRAIAAKQSKSAKYLNVEKEAKAATNITSPFSVGLDLPLRPSAFSYSFVRENWTPQVGLLTRYHFASATNQRFSPAIVHNVPSQDTATLEEMKMMQAHVQSALFIHSPEYFGLPLKGQNISTVVEPDNTDFSATPTVYYSYMTDPELAKEVNLSIRELLKGAPQNYQEFATKYASQVSSTARLNYRNFQSLTGGVMGYEDEPSYTLGEPLAPIFGGSASKLLALYINFIKAFNRSIT
jgi:hypothetical protein